LAIEHPSVINKAKAATSTGLILYFIS
jgi:hypothetical protein